MKIKNINIIEFGKLNNYVLNFDNGFNLIYGENESGKSTIIEFIRVMLYGMSNQKRDIRNNARRKYIPFGKTAASGEILIEYNGTEILIKRTFGISKKLDSIMVLDKTHGERINKLEVSDPFFVLSNLSEMAFIRTYFTSQNSIEFKENANESILKKIIAISEKKEEDMDLDKSINLIDETIKKIENSRNTGEKDKLLDKLYILNFEKERLLKLNKENIEDEIKLKKLHETKNSSKNIIDTSFLSEEIKKKIDERKLYKEVEKIIDEKNNLINQKEILEKLLKHEDKVLQNTDISNLRGITLENRKNKEIQKNKKYKYESLENEIESIKGNLNLFKNYEKLQDDFDIKIEKILNEQRIYKMSLDNKTEDNVSIKNKLKSAKEKIASKKEFLLVDNELENKINKLFEDNKKNKMNKVSIFVIFLLLLICAIFIYFRLNIIFIIISLISIFLVFIIDKFVLNNNEEMDAILNKFSVNTFEEFKDTLRDVRETLKEINLLQREEEFFENKEIQIIYKKNQKFLDFAIEYTGESNIDNAISKFKEFKIKKEILNSLQKEKEKIKIEIIEIEKQIEEYDKNVNEKLYNFIDSKYYSKNFEDIFKEVEEKIEIYNKIILKIYSKDEIINKLLNGREFESLRHDEIKNIEINYTSNTNNKELYNDFIKLEKEIKDVENSIKTRFINERDIVEVEEEILKTKENIKEWEEKIKALQIVKEVLVKYYKGIKKEILPRINKTSSMYLDKLTNKKYSEMIFSVDSEIIVVENTNHVNINYLSKGTIDIVYLCVRLSLIKSIEENNPIFFDEILSMFDDSRVENALKILIEISNNHQIFLFSCQKREKDILGDKVNLIEI